MYATKNSITLACFLVIFLTVGFIWSRKDKDELERLRSDMKRIESQYQENNRIVEKLDDLQVQYEYLQSEWNNAPKVLISADEPAFSYFFLNKIITEKRIAFDINFILSEQIKRKAFSSFLYTLDGQGSFADVYKLITYLIATPILYQIKSLRFNSADANSDDIKFSIKLESYSMRRDDKSSNAMKVIEDYDVPITPVNFSHNTFKPLLYQPKNVRSSSGPRISRTSTPRKRIEVKLPEIRKSTLQAAMADKILIKDQNGKISTISVGEKVKEGYLSKINLDRSEAEFIMRDQNVLILGLGYVREGGKIRSDELDGKFIH